MPRKLRFKKPKKGLNTRRSNVNEQEESSQSLLPPPPPPSTSQNLDITLDVDNEDDALLEIVSVSGKRVNTSQIPGPSKKPALLEGIQCAALPQQIQNAVQKEDEKRLHSNKKVKFHTSQVAGPSKAPQEGIICGPPPRHNIYPDSSDDDEEGGKIVPIRNSNIASTPQYVSMFSSSSQCIVSISDDHDNNDANPGTTMVESGGDDDDVVVPNEQQEPNIIEPVARDNIEANVVDVLLLNAMVFERLTRNCQDRQRYSFYLEAGNQQRPVLHSIGGMVHQCPHCMGKYFQVELNTRRYYSGCCNNGQVRLPALITPFPNLLQNLMLNNDQQHSRHFKENILQYNYAFQFASIEAKRRDLPGRGPYVYCIEGRMVHHISDININAQNISYGQVYFLDSNRANAQRIHNSNDLNRELIEQIGDILQRHNPFAQAYRHLYEVYEEQQRQRLVNPPNIVLEFLNVRGRQNRPYDMPIVNEVAAVYQFRNEGLPPTTNLRVFLRQNNQSLFTNISPQNEFVDALTFPLLFPFGESGWTMHTARNDRNRNMTLNSYYKYRLAYRDDFSAIHSAGKLSQQYIVAAYVKMESNRLLYIERHQNQLRAEEYVGLRDYLHNRAAVENINIGRMVILPSSYIGSPRSQQQRFQDAMSMVTTLGYPSLFITFTCNPKWNEIVNAIPHNTQSNDHPMIIARVFQMKLKAFMSDILENHIFGIHLGSIHVIEFQKRGLPHAHILIILRHEDRMLEPERVDLLVSAEIPDPIRQPELYELVKTHMVHGPCGPQFNNNAICMVDGKCSKTFPKQSSNETIITENGRIQYRRRHTGITIVKGPHVLNNQWIAPYNPYCLYKYKCHINVEACGNLKTVKYLYKYIFKGVDMALLRIRNIEEERNINEMNVDENRSLSPHQIQGNYNEVEEYLNARYISPSEAAWRINDFVLHDSTHTVIRLPVHLEERQNVIFRENDLNIPERLDLYRRTMLTEWFTLNRNNLYNSRQYLYVEIPPNFTWIDRAREWRPRQRNRSTTLARMYSVSIRNRELYFLRLLLLHVRGATSFEDVRTVDGEICPTYAEACSRRNLLNEDMEWQRALREAVEQQMPNQLRQMFATILAFCTVLDPLALWNEFRDALMEDFTRHGIDVIEAENRTLYKLKLLLNVHGLTLANFKLPEPLAIYLLDYNNDDDNDDDDDDDDNRIDVEFEQQQSANWINQLNIEQRHIFDNILTSINNNNDDHLINHLFYLDGAAGTGKTFLYNTIISYARGQEIKVLAMAWTGLAASLLIGGKTVHSTFKLPVPLLETSTSSIRIESSYAEILRQVKLIIWDEISMVTAMAFQKIDEILRFLCRTPHLPFGGKTVIVGGDFKQCLPIVPYPGTRNQIVAACVKSAQLWNHFQQFSLTINVRVLPEQVEFSQWLLNLGNDRLPHLPNFQYSIIQIPEQCIVQNYDQLINSCFDIINNNDNANLRSNNNVLLKSVILTPLNETCDKINKKVLLEKINGPTKIYYSVDSIEPNDADDAIMLEAANYQPEFLNALTPSGLPPHRLELKVGALVMLLRNLNIRKGLCNGTRLIVQFLGQNYIKGQVVSNDGNRLTNQFVLIPKIDFIPSNTNLPFQFRRRQFPVRLAYALTINKAQGQTYDHVSLYLPNSVFAHGQLYVAFSRVRKFNDISVFIENTATQGRLLPEENTNFIYTKNIVYNEIL